MNDEKLLADALQCARDAVVLLESAQRVQCVGLRADLLGSAVGCLSVANENAARLRRIAKAKQSEG